MFIIVLISLLLLAAVLAPWLGTDSRDLDPTRSPHTYPALPDRDGQRR
jgi:hypothetical protein